MTELAVLARTILEGINARDLDTVASFLDPGYEAEWPEGLLDFEGSILREAAMLTALPDTRFEIERISPIAEDRVLVEAWANGTLQDRLDLPYGLTAPATGRSIRVPILFLMTFRDDILVSERVLFDQLRLLHDAGALGTIVDADASRGER